MQTIVDLIRDNMFSNFGDNSGHSKDIVVINTEEGVEDSGMSVDTDEDLHREVRLPQSQQLLI